MNVICCRQVLHSAVIKYDLVLYSAQELTQYDKGVSEMGEHKYHVIFMIELANAYIEQNAVMVVFVNAGLTFVAMTHANPFYPLAFFAIIEWLVPI